MTYDKDVQTAEIIVEAGPSEEDIRERILRERELEDQEKLRKEKELEEESAQLDKDIEQEIRGVYPHWCSLKGLFRALSFYRAYRGGASEHFRSSRIP